SGPEPRHALKDITAQRHLARIELKRVEDVDRSIEELERARHDGNHIAGLSVDDEPPPDDAGGATEAALPVPVRQDHGACAARRIVARGEFAAKLRWDAEDRQDLVRDNERLHLLGT